MKTKMMFVFVVIALLLSSCTVQVCWTPKVFGYNPHPREVCRQVYTDGTYKPVYTIHPKFVVPSVESQ